MHDYRKLLFGLLAVRFTGVSKADVAALASRWIKDPSMPLDKQVVIIGELSPDDRDFVQAKVEAALAENGQDAKKAVVAEGGKLLLGKTFGTTLDALLASEDPHAKEAQPAAQPETPTAAVVQDVQDVVRDALGANLVQVNPDDSLLSSIGDDSSERTEASPSGFDTAHSANHGRVRRESLKRWIARNSSAVAVGCVGVVLLGIVTTAAYVRVAQERDVALAAQRQSEIYLGEALAEKARSSAAKKDWMSAEVYAAAALQRQEDASVRGLWLSLHGRWKPKLIWQQQTGTECPRAVVAPSGRIVACPTLMTLILWDIRTGAQAARFTYAAGWLTDVSFSVDGKWVAAATKDGKVALWDLATGQLLRQLHGHQRPTLAVAFSPNGRWLVSAGEDGTIALWSSADLGDVDTADDKVPSKSLSRHRHAVRSLAWSADGTLLATAGQGGSVVLWPFVGDRVPNRSQSRVLPVGNDPLTAVRISADGGHVAIASGDPNVRVFDSQSGEVLHVLCGHRGSVLALDFSPDGTHLVSGGADSTVRLWNVMRGSLEASFRGHTGGVGSVDFSADGSQVATASKDKSVRLWQFEGRAMAHRLLGSDSPLRSVAVSPDRLLVAAGGTDGVVRIWERKSGRQISTLEGHSQRVSALSFHPSGEILASASFDKSVRLWNLNTDRAGLQFEPHGEKVRSVAFSPDGKLLASGGDDRLIQLTDIERPEASQTLRGHESLITTVAFSADGRLLASGSWDGSARLWDVGSGQQKHRLVGHDENVYAVAFAPRHAVLVTAGADATIRLWDTQRGQLIGVYKGHTGPVRSLSVHANGSIVASAGDDAVVRLWDRQTQRQVAVLTGHTGPIRGLAFADEGDVLVSASVDKTVRQWIAAGLRVPAQDLLKKATHEYGLVLEGINAIPVASPNRR